MLCLQQCIDLCDLTPEQAQAIRENATLAEIAAIQAECPHACDDPTMEASACALRNLLLEEVHAAADFGDLARVVEHYCLYAAARDAVG